MGHCGDQGVHPGIHPGDKLAIGVDETTVGSEAMVQPGQVDAGDNGLSLVPRLRNLLGNGSVQGGWVISSGGIGDIDRFKGLGQVGQGIVQGRGVIGQEGLQVVNVEHRGGSSLGGAQVGIVSSREIIVVDGGLGFIRGLC